MDVLPINNYLGPVTTFTYNRLTIFKNEIKGHFEDCCLLTTVITKIDYFTRKLEEQLQETIKKSLQIGRANECVGTLHPQLPPKSLPFFRQTNQRAFVPQAILLSDLPVKYAINQPVSKSVKGASARFALSLASK